MDSLFGRRRRRCLYHDQYNQNYRQHYHHHEETVDQSQKMTSEDKDEMDFDKENVDTEKTMFQKELAFPIDEDMVNLGVWIQIHHPNFFDTTTKGHFRYAFWFLFTSLNLFV